MINFFFASCLEKMKPILKKIKRRLNCKKIGLVKTKEVKEIIDYDIGALLPITHKQKIKQLRIVKLAC